MIKIIMTMITSMLMVIVVIKGNTNTPNCNNCMVIRLDGITQIYVG